MIGELHAAPQASRRVTTAACSASALTANSAATSALDGALLAAAAGGAGLAPAAPRPAEVLALPVAAAATWSTPAATRSAAATQAGCRAVLGAAAVAGCIMTPAAAAWSSTNMVVKGSPSAEGCSLAHASCTWLQVVDLMPAYAVGNSCTEQGHGTAVELGYHVVGYARGPPERINPYTKCGAVNAGPRRGLKHRLAIVSFSLLNHVSRAYARHLQAQTMPLKLLPSPDSSAQSCPPC